MEILTVIALLGILISSAQPIYRTYTERTKKIHAMAALLRGTIAMEKYYNLNNSYLGATSATIFDTTMLANSYILEVKATATTFKLTATLNPSIPSPCQYLAIDHRGERMPMECWF